MHSADIFSSISPIHLGKCLHAFPPTLFFTLSDQQGTRADTLDWASWATPRIDAMTMSIRVVMDIVAVTSGTAAHLSGNPVCD